MLENCREQRRFQHFSLNLHKTVSCVERTCRLLIPSVMCLWLLRLFIFSLFIIKYPTQWTWVTRQPAVTWIVSNFLVFDRTQSFVIVLTKNPPLVPFCYQINPIQIVTQLFIWPILILYPQFMDVSQLASAIQNSFRPCYITHTPLILIPSGDE